VSSGRRLGEETGATSEAGRNGMHEMPESRHDEQPLPVAALFPRPPNDTCDGGVVRIRPSQRSQYAHMNGTGQVKF